MEREDNGQRPREEVAHGQHIRYMLLDVHSYLIGGKREENEDFADLAWERSDVCDISLHLLTNLDVHLRT